MPEAVIEWIGAELINLGAEEIGVHLIFQAGTIATAASVALTVASVYTLREQQRSAQARAKDAYNASLRDRYIMQRSATEQRALVLGRCRVSGPVVFAKSYGTSLASLAFIVALAAHECDAIDDVYFDDSRLILDGAGYVVGALKTETFSISTASASFTLAEAAITCTAEATYDTGDVTLSTSLSSDGLTVTVSGASSTKIGSLRVEYRPKNSVYETSTLRTITTTNTVTVVANGSGFGAYAPPGITSLGPVSAVYRPPGGGPDQVLSTSSYPDHSMSFSGAPPGASVLVSYQSTGSAVAGSRARVRKYLGGAGQTADAGLISALPSYWTSAHVGSGICYLVVELDYDPDAFPGGLPNVSAVVRGLKCYDPRTGTTAWTDNPALLMRGFWTHPLGANRSSGEVDDASVIAAANACDTSVTYTLNTTSSGAIKYTRPLYAAGTVARKDRRAADVLNDLAQAMGGRWVVANNTLRVRAGSYVAPVVAINEAWLHDGSAVEIQPRRTRADTINATVGTFADASRDFQVLSYPKVPASAYVTADGRELQTDIHYPAVTFVGQAQFLSAAALRYARAGLTVKLSCNMRAYPLEVFDVVTLTLARFGWSAKTFEVLETSFGLDGLVELTLKEIDAAIWTLDASFSATDFAKKTLLPSPWSADVPVLNTPASGSTHLLRQADGTIVSRIYVSWAAITNPNVVAGGSIEVQWQRVGDSTGTWQSLTVPGDAASAYIANVADGNAYIIRARSRTRLAASDWSAQQVHVVVGKSAPPATPTGFAYADAPGGSLLTWTANTEPDYLDSLLAVGATYGTATPLWQGSANAYLWLQGTAGTYTVWLTHRDTSGNVSTPVSLSVVVSAASAALLQVEYSIDGVTSWHSTFTTGDIYMRQRVGSSGTWQGPIRIVGADGAAGPTGPTGATGSAGANGTRTADAKVYSNPYITGSGAPTISGTSTYTWSSGTLGSAPSGWNLTPPTPSAGYSVDQAVVRLSNTSTTPTDTVNWSGASTSVFMSAALQGGSSRIAYAKSTSVTLAGTPTSYTTSGNSSFPPTNTWGGSEVWGGTVPSYGAGEAVFQLSGIYDPAANQTTWGAPLLSAWKVAFLSAISANLGTVTAGTINGITINGTTITGGVIQTATSGARVVINGTGSNAIAVYSDSGAGVVQTARIGGVGYGTVASFGDQTAGTTSDGVTGSSAAGIGVVGLSKTGTAAVYGYSSYSGATAIGVYGYANAGAGVRGESSSSYGGYFSGNTGLYAAPTGTGRAIVAANNSTGETVNISNTGGGLAIYCPSGGAQIAGDIEGGGVMRLAPGGTTRGSWYYASGTLVFEAYGAVPVRIASNGAAVADFDASAGVKVFGKFGCNGATPQGKVTLPADATDDTTAYALANAMKALLIANGQAQ